MGETLKGEKHLRSARDKTGIGQLLRLRGLSVGVVIRCPTNQGITRAYVDASLTPRTRSVGGFHRMGLNESDNQEDGRASVGTSSIGFHYAPFGAACGRRSLKLKGPEIIENGILVSRIHPFVS